MSDYKNNDLNNLKKKSLSVRKFIKTFVSHKLINIKKHNIIKYNFTFLFFNLQFSF